MTDARREDRPGAIDARPVRHPGRWVALAVILVLVAMMVSSFVTNDALELVRSRFEIMQQTPGHRRACGRAPSSAPSARWSLGIVLGIILAVMRLSPNPVLRGVAFVYTWFFRAIPRYVLLAILGSGIGFLYNPIDIGVPFGQQLASLLGLVQRPHLLHPRRQPALEHRSGSASSASACPRRPTWPRSPGPASCRSTRARPRRRRRSA